MKINAVTPITVDIKLNASIVSENKFEPTTTVKDNMYNVQSFLFNSAKGIFITLHKKNTRPHLQKPNDAITSA